MSSLVLLPERARPGGEVFLAALLALLCGAPSPRARVGCPVLDVYMEGMNG